LRGIDLKLYDGSTNTVRLDPAGPSLAMGSTLPSGYGTGTGIWMGKDSGAYKARFGDPAGNRLTWDGSSLDVVGGGTFTRGSIGGWTMASNQLSSGSGSNFVGLNSTAGTVRIWAGGETAASAPFRVYENGSLTATNATITQGAVAIDSNGITITPSSTPANARAFRFTSPGGLGDVFGLYSYEDSGGTRAISIENTATGATTVQTALLASAGAGHVAQWTLNTSSAATPAITGIANIVNYGSLQVSSGSALGTGAGLTVDQDIYAGGNVSAASYTDRSPSGEARSLSDAVTALLAQVADLQARVAALEAAQARKQ
jgi:hypothetical protein